MSLSSATSVEDESSQCKRLEEFVQVERGLPLVTRNGQRISGPPENWEGPPPPKGSEAFIGKLPIDATEIELLPFLEQVGTVYTLRLMIDHRGHNRGFGFVTYANPATAQRAARELDQTYLRPRKRVAVVPSIDNRRLFFGGLPLTATAQDILNEVTARVKNVACVILYACADDRARNRGFAFVEFVDHMSAAIARKELQLDDKCVMFKEAVEGGHKIQVDWAVPEPQVDAEQMANVTNLFVRNVSINVAEDELLKLFSLDGKLEVTRVRRPSNYAFIHFARREDAETAMNSLNGSSLDGLNLEVEWAKPPPREDRIILDTAEQRYRSRPNKSGRRGRHSTYSSSATSGASSVTSRSTRSSARLSRPPPPLQHRASEPVSIYPMPPQGLESSTEYPMAAPVTSGLTHLNEMDQIAIQLFGCLPEFEALTCPMGNGRKQFYPCINIAGHKEVLNSLYQDRRAAVDAAASYCMARLQLTLQVFNSNRMPPAIHPTEMHGPSSLQASFQALQLNDGAVPPPMTGFLPTAQVPVLPQYVQTFPAVAPGIVGVPSASTLQFHQPNGII